MIKRIVCVAGALLGAVALSQTPEYTQQYTQRLAGAVDELTTIITRFDEDAARFGLSREEGLERYQASPDDFLAGRGLSMQAVFARHEALAAQLADLRAAGGMTKILSLTQYFDSDVGAAALEDFRPAVPVTLEGLAFALVGWVMGYALAWGGATTAAAPFRRRRPRVRVSRR
ncbi:DUF2937 family protein [Pelagibacterium lacus]|uniref:DUF2937 family protein n=1 Tax=Pelagibacterium lacus TaxID=2282655 RepID=A0A369W4Y5_9HYPH|nr:DUF2937 family protein [Pelagibacterium lacus]RDE09393.1 DUF2937 family protein [Pelagibacterium lacus]